MNRTTETKREKTVTRYFRLFLLKFLEESVASKPKSFCVIGDTLTLRRFILISFDCLTDSMGLIFIAFLAGMYAEIITVMKLISPAAINARGEKTKRSLRSVSSARKVEIESLRK